MDEWNDKTIFVNFFNRNIFKKYFKHNDFNNLEFHVNDEYMKTGDVYLSKLGFKNENDITTYISRTSGRCDSSVMHNLFVNIVLRWNFYISFRRDNGISIEEAKNRLKECLDINELPKEFSGYWTYFFHFLPLMLLEIQQYITKNREEDGMEEHNFNIKESLTKINTCRYLNDAGNIVLVGQIDINPKKRNKGKRDDVGDFGLTEEETNMTQFTGGDLVLLRFIPKDTAYLEAYDVNPLSLQLDELWMKHHKSEGNKKQASKLPNWNDTNLGELYMFRKYIVRHCLGYVKFHDKRKGMYHIKINLDFENFDVIDQCRYKIVKNVVNHWEDGIYTCVISKLLNLHPLANLFMSLYHLKDSHLQQEIIQGKIIDEHSNQYSESDQEEKEKQESLLLINRSDDDDDDDDDDDENKSVTLTDHLRKLKNKINIYLSKCKEIQEEEDVEKATELTQTISFEKRDSDSDESFCNVSINTRKCKNKSRGIKMFRLIPSGLKKKMLKSFNHYQLKAINNAVMYKGITLIHGPPGTGKTTTILGIISSYIFKEGTKSHKETIEERWKWVSSSISNSPMRYLSSNTTECSDQRYFCKLEYESTSSTCLFQGTGSSLDTVHGGSIDDVIVRVGDFLEQSEEIRRALALDISIMLATRQLAKIEEEVLEKHEMYDKKSHIKRSLLFRMQKHRLSKLQKLAFKYFCAILHKKYFNRLREEEKEELNLCSSSCFFSGIQKKYDLFFYANEAEFKREKEKLKEQAKEDLLKREDMIEEANMKSKEEESGTLKEDPFSKKKSMNEIYKIVLSNMWKKKILVCASSNVAIDEILRRICSANKGIMDENGSYFNPIITRVGRNVSTDLVEYSLSFKEQLYKQFWDWEYLLLHDSEKPQKKEKNDIAACILGISSIVCSTLSACTNKAILSNITYFDVVIIDEAGQTVEPEILRTLRYCCENIILVGDSKQLPATVLSATAQKYKYSRSMFERLQKKFENNKKKNNLLVIQYRMHPEISNFPKKHYYKNKIVDAPYLMFTVFKEKLIQNSLEQMDMMKDDKEEISEINDKGNDDGDVGTTEKNKDADAHADKKSTANKKNSVDKSNNERVSSVSNENLATSKNDINESVKEEKWTPLFDYSEMMDKYFSESIPKHDLELCERNKGMLDWFFIPFLRHTVFYDIKESSEELAKTSYLNICESEMVLQFIEFLHCIFISENINDWYKKIGIITPYAAEKVFLQYILNKFFTEKGYSRETQNFIEIGTVDGFQGVEKDIIILICVRTSGGSALKVEPKLTTKNDSSKASFSTEEIIDEMDETTVFFCSQKRLNVALTRAKHNLFIFGNATFLEGCGAWYKIIEHYKQQRKIYKVSCKHYLKRVDDMKKMLKQTNQDKLFGLNSAFSNRKIENSIINEMLMGELFSNAKILVENLNWRKEEKEEKEKREETKKELGETELAEHEEPKDTLKLNSSKKEEEEEEEEETEFLEKETTEETKNQTKKSKKKKGKDGQEKAKEALEDRETISNEQKLRLEYPNFFIDKFRKQCKKYENVYKTAKLVLPNFTETFVTVHEHISTTTAAI